MRNLQRQPAQAGGERVIAGTRHPSRAKISSRKWIAVGVSGSSVETVEQVFEMAGPANKVDKLIARIGREPGRSMYKAWMVFRHPNLATPHHTECGSLFLML